MAAGPAPPLLLPPPGEKGTGPPLSPAAAVPQDARVRCCSRRGLGEVMALCAPFVRALAQGQPGESAAAGDALWNFETAMRENITINGQPWEETSGDSDLYSGSDMKTLDDQIEELIVETTKKRKQWPKKILKHAVQTYKAEQEMLDIKRSYEDAVINCNSSREKYGHLPVIAKARNDLKLYQPFVAPEEIRSQLSQDAYIADLKQMAEMVFKEIGGAMKSLPALIERAEGFSQVLTWQPTLELCRLRQEVFSVCKAKQENNVQNDVSPGEVTPTDAVIRKNPYVLLKRRKTASSPERRRYPVGGKIALVT